MLVGQYESITFISDDCVHSVRHRTDDILYSSQRNWSERFPKTTFECRQCCSSGLACIDSCNLNAPRHESVAPCRCLCTRRSNIGMHSHCGIRHWNSYPTIAICKKAVYHGSIFQCYLLLSAFDCTSNTSLSYAPLVRIMWPSQRSLLSLVVAYAIFCLISSLGGVVVYVVCAAQNDRGFDSSNRDTLGSSCGRAAHTHLPSQAWRYEQPATAISTK